ncbi:tetratricopeptide repeat protein [Streptomyces sp. NBC_00728]|uniref:tetratricopeptide repeat protein n=1 Tax=Streptomyces sp. NBC_00728 TaxID=2903676 RepID=UPI00386B6B7D
MVVLTAAPAGVKAGELPWPKWLVAGAVAAAGVLVAIWTPLVKARTDALAARTTREAEREAQAEGALERLPGVKGKALLVKDMNDRTLLGIHEAIPLPTDSGPVPDLSTELPTYVPRDIDADLRTSLQASSKTGGFVLLVGPAAAGKTRCAYEAIRAVLPNWRLFMPPDGATLNEMVAGGADLDRSVVWLNETQNFLTGSNQLKALTVRRLLTDTSRPVILVGTIWPKFFDQLRSPVPALEGEGEEQQQVLTRDAREILELSRRFSLTKWSVQEWRRAENLASVDPRIQQAWLHHGSSGLAQILSAAPELIHRWEQADNPLGQAVIAAAVAARRCGHPPNLPTFIIEVLAKEFLTDTQRATAGEDWLNEALNWACQPVHHSGGIAPLQAFGAEMGRIDGYQVSDILVDHRNQSSPVLQRRITSNVWALLAELAPLDACSSIGFSAYRADVRDAAQSAWQRAAEAGEANCMAALAGLLREIGDSEGALAWCSRAAELGNDRAMAFLGNLLGAAGDSEGAFTWYTRAAEAGNTNAMAMLGALAGESDDNDGARTWWRRAAEAGNINAMVPLGILLSEAGDSEGAFTWYIRAAEAGNDNAMALLGNFLREADDDDGARTWYTRAAEAGNSNAMGMLGVLAGEADDDDGARTWYTRAAEAGNTNAMVSLGRFSENAGDGDGARTWYTRAAEAGNTNAMTLLGIFLSEAGDSDGARIWWQRAAEAEDANAMALLGALASEAGDGDGARTWCTRAAEAGNTNAMRLLGVLLSEAGDGDGARTWYTRAAEAGDTNAAEASRLLTETTE